MKQQHWQLLSTSLRHRKEQEGRGFLPIPTSFNSKSTSAVLHSAKLNSRKSAVQVQGSPIQPKQPSAGDVTPLCQMHTENLICSLKEKVYIVESKYKIKLIKSITNSQQRISSINVTLICNWNEKSKYISEHRWFSGRMLACHAGGPGSIPGRCSRFFLYSIQCL